jgi:hypothetical protein
LSEGSSIPNLIRGSVDWFVYANFVCYVFYRRNLTLASVFNGNMLFTEESFFSIDGRIRIFTNNNESSGAQKLPDPEQWKVQGSNNLM